MFLQHRQRQQTVTKDSPSAFSPEGKAYKRNRILGISTNLPQSFESVTLIGYITVDYLSNRPHFRWVYRRDKSRGMLGEHEKSL